ncbi:GAF domain-containing sensor histidine kinase [Candidatus Daviesbacteria bacterium]|nr:GAF domain-containing sensor histidine kinase [Candidatus Daviesbacteria bacterium]
MVSENKITTFLKLQQTVLDIEDSTKLLEQFLPQVLTELNTVGYPYIFLSAIFTDSAGEVKQTFFIDNKGSQSPVNQDSVFQKGSEWEMKVMYGEAAVVSDVSYFINPSYPQFHEIYSLLVLPIRHIRDLRGVLILASPKDANTVEQEEIEFGEMLTRLVDLAYRLQDTESSLLKITQQVYGMNAKLHQLDKLKDDFVSVTSHELRTPMTAIRSYVWMALHKSDIPLSQKLERYLYRTLVSTERLINLVNDMLNVSRIESGSIEVTPKPFDITALVKDVMEEVKMKAGEKNVHLEVTQKAVPQIFADADKVHEILLNLIGNSLKFAFPGGTIAVGFFTDGKNVEVSVKDNGPGISRDDLGRLFHKFSRLDNSYTAISTSGGTGLGLFISKSLIDLMHGKIWVESEGLNKGATFTFSLPVASKETLQHAEEYEVKAQGEVKKLEPVAI